MSYSRGGGRVHFLNVYFDEFEHLVRVQMCRQFVNKSVAIAHVNQWPRVFDLARFKKESLHLTISN